MLAELEAMADKVDQVAEAVTNDVRLFYAVENLDDQITSDSGSDSSSETSDANFEDIIEDLKVCNEGLLDLAPSLENPAYDGTAIELTTADLKDNLHNVAEPARPFVRMIRDRFLSIPADLVKKLGEANWQRRERLREKLASAQMLRISSSNDDETSNGSGLIVDLKKSQLCINQDTQWRCNICAETFTATDSLRIHINITHDGDFISSQVEEVMAASKRQAAKQGEKEMFSFCQTTPSQTQKSFAGHVGKHMQDISLAALPTLNSCSDSDSSDSMDTIINNFSHKGIRVSEDLRLSSGVIGEKSQRDEVSLVFDLTKMRGGIIAHRSQHLLQTLKGHQISATFVSQANNPVCVGVDISMLKRVYLSGAPPLTIRAPLPPSVEKTAPSSLYKDCLKLGRRLSRVPGFERHLIVADGLDDSNPNESKSADPVLFLWNFLRQGFPLLIIYNCLQPATPLEVIDATPYESSRSRNRKRAAFKFVRALVNELRLDLKQCFLLTDLFGDEIMGFVKVCLSKSHYNIMQFV